MKLIDVIRQISALDESSTIYAAEPWNPSSEAIVAPEPETGGLPVEAQSLGLKYFLEVFIARDFLEGWLENENSEPTDIQKCKRLIEYAINDA